MDAHSHSSVLVPKYLPSELLAKAKDELNEFPEDKQYKINMLKDMVLAEDNLIALMDDEFLVRFLRARKFDCSRAFKVLQRYYQMRLEYPKLYENFKPSSLLNALQSLIQFIILPEKDTAGRAIFLMRFGQWNPDEFSLDEIFRCFQMCLETAILDEATQISGVVLAVSMENFGIKHAGYLMPPAVKKFISLIQDSFPMRMKGIHLIREPEIYHIVYALIRPFLSEKLSSRVFMHGWNLDEFHKFIPKEILPEEFGGNAQPVDNSEFVNSLLARDEYYLRLTEFGYRLLDDQNRNDITRL